MPEKSNKDGSELRRDLEGALNGHHIIVVNPDALTIGLLEDMQSGNIALLIDAVERCVAGGDLPHGNDREGIRKLNGAEFGSLSRAVSEAYRVPDLPARSS